MQNIHINAIILKIKFILKYNLNANLITIKTLSTSDI